MASKVTERIESLEQRLRSLKSQKSKSDARRRSLDHRRSRREGTRRKILVGAIVLAKMEDGSLDRTLLNEWLSAALEHDEDRALFELDALPTPAGPAIRSPEREGN